MDEDTHLNDWQRESHEFTINNHDMGLVVAGLAVLTGYLRSLKEGDQPDNQAQADRTEKLYHKLSKQWIEA